MAVATLYLIDALGLDFDAAWQRLNGSERRRAERFIFDRDRRRWAIFRAEIKRLLATHLGAPLPDWREDSHGKPFLLDRPVEFNLSHSETLAALLISEAGPVGIDLEPLSRGHDLLEDAAAFCHPDELAVLPASPAARADHLIRLWTTKEAFLKALGTGLSQPPAQILIVGDRAVGPPGGLADLHRLVPGHDQRLIDYALAAAVPDEITELRIAEA